MALELCRGQSLAARLISGPLPWRDAVQIGILVAAALDAFHARGVIHPTERSNCFAVRFFVAYVMCRPVLGSTMQNMLAVLRS